MALVLAIEPDLRQAAILKRIVREKVRAQLVLVDSRDAAISAIDAQIPDVILVTALLSPRDEEELVAHLKMLEGAEHLQTHTIPQLASAHSAADNQAGGGLFGKFRRKKESDPIPGCDPDLFADEISTFLDRASQLKAEALATLHHRVAELEAQRPVKAPADSPDAPPPSDPISATASTAPAGASSWASPFEWRRESPAPAAREKKAEEPPKVVTRPLVANVPLAVLADEEQQRAEVEAAQRRIEAEAARQRETEERQRAEAESARQREAEERRQKEEEARVAREREEAERKRKEAEAKAAREREEAERKRKAEEARLARERQEREEAERKRKEAEARAARERQEREEAERRRKEAEAKAARERQEREEAERRRKEAEARAARERQERAEAERRRLEAQARAERERREREEAERRRLEAEAKAERERREREEAERLRLEAEAAAERAERERLEREAAERERIAAAERAAREKAEAEAAARARQARRKVAAAVKQFGRPPALHGVSKPPEGDDRYAEFRDGYDDARRGILRLLPLAIWARAERPAATDRPDPTLKDDLQEIMSRLAMPPQVAGVHYPRGCRIRRVRVPAAGATPRKYAKPLIVSRKALDERNAER